MEQEGVREYFEEQEGMEVLTKDRPGDSDPPEVDSVIVRPSFFERLHKIAEADFLQSEVASMLFPMSETIFFAKHYGKEDPSVEKLLIGHSYQDAVKDGVLRRLWLWVRGFKKHGEPASLDFTQRVPVGELHAPNVRNANVKYKLSSSTQTKMKLDVKIFGMGVGGSTSRKVTIGIQQDVKAGVCLGLVVSTNGSVQQWQNPETSETVLTVDITSMDDLVYPVKLDNYPVFRKETHVCLNPKAYDLLYDRILSSDYDLGENCHAISPEVDGFHPFIEISTVRKYEVTWRMLTPTGDEHGIVVSSRFEHAVSADYELPPGHQYLAVYNDEEHLPMQWLAGKIQKMKASRKHRFKF